MRKSDFCNPASHRRYLHGAALKYSYESHYRVTNVSRMMAVCFTAQRQVSLVAAVTRARIPRNKRRIGQLYNYTFVVEEDRGVRDLFIRFLWDLLLNVVINTDLAAVH